MTREETKKCIEVMQAYVDGKEIEFKNHLSREMIDYELVDGDPLWDWNSSKYRIKEEPKPFSIGDLVYSSYHEAEGTIEERDEKHLAVRFGDKLYFYYSKGELYPSGKADLQKAKEPLSFSWRGKNIQWVRFKGDTVVLGVLAFNDDGVKHGTGHFPWHGADKFEWSEDNQTWRKFE